MLLLLAILAEEGEQEEDQPLIDPQDEEIPALDPHYNSPAPARIARAPRSPSLVFHPSCPENKGRVLQERCVLGWLCGSKGCSDVIANGWAGVGWLKAGAGVRNTDIIGLAFRKSNRRSHHNPTQEDCVQCCAFPQLSPMDGTRWGPKIAEIDTSRSMWTSTTSMQNTQRKTQGHVSQGRHHHIPRHSATQHQRPL